MTMRKGRNKWMVWAAVIVVSFCLGFFIRQPAGATTTEPGSSTDPIAAKSYVDQMATYTLVTVEKGQKLIANEGTEFVLRMGSAVAYNVAPNAGLANLTTGKDISSAVVIPLNNHILTPRSGRGFRASNTVLVLIKGTYTIQS